MAKLCFISDTHGLHDQVKVPECDILIHSGDCTNDIGRQSLREFCVWFNRQPAKHKVLVAGNHDGAFQKWPKESRELFTQYVHSGYYLQDSGAVIMDLKFWGSPWTPNFYDWYFMTHTPDERLNIWSKMPMGLDVLVTHGPPYGHLDVSGFDRQHCGDKILCTELMVKKPKVHAFGHIHYSYGSTTINHTETTLINAAICGEDYRPTRSPILFHVDPSA